MRTRTLMMLAGMLACTSPVSPRGEDAETDLAAFDRTVRNGARTFVLLKVESQSREPFVTFDMVCDGVRYEFAVRDTIQFTPDSGVRRASVHERRTDGELIQATGFTARGKWAPYGGTEHFYYSEGAAIQLTLTPENYPGRDYVLLFRVEAESMLSRLAALGGDCGVAGGSARFAPWFYRAT